MADNKPECKVRDNGDKLWWLNDKLHREDGPAIEYTNGNKFWFLNGEFHREDGPAIECASEHKEWWLNGELHREDGPAVEYADGAKEWWLNGKEINKLPFKRKTLKPGSVVYHKKKTYICTKKKGSLYHFLLGKETVIYHE